MGLLRYEWKAGSERKAKAHHYAVGFDQNVTNPLQATPSGGQLRGGIEFAGPNEIRQNMFVITSRRNLDEDRSAYVLNPRTTDTARLRDVLRAEALLPAELCLRSRLFFPGHQVCLLERCGKPLPVSSEQSLDGGLLPPSGNMPHGFTMQGVGSSVTTWYQGSKVLLCTNSFRH